MIVTILSEDRHVDLSVDRARRLAEDLLALIVEFEYGVDSNTEWFRDAAGQKRCFIEVGDPCTFIHPEELEIGT